MISQDSNMAILNTYLSEYGSHNSMTFIELLHCAMINLLRRGLLFFHIYPSYHGLEHFIHLSYLTSSSSSRNCWFTIELYSVM
jgi:hypothetical protein